MKKNLKIISETDDRKNFWRIFLTPNFFTGKFPLGRILILTFIFLSFIKFGTAKVTPSPGNEMCAPWSSCPDSVCPTGGCDTAGCPGCYSWVDNENACTVSFSSGPWVGFPLTMSMNANAWFVWTCGGVPGTVSGSASSPVNYTFTPTSPGIVRCSIGAAYANYTVGCSNEVGVTWPPIECRVNRSNVGINQTVTASAEAGIPLYTWTASGSTNPGPIDNDGSSFQTSWATTGSKTIRVRDSRGTLGTCDVDVSANPVICSPTTQNAAMGTNVSFSAVGGTTFSYRWNAPGGNPVNQNTILGEFTTLYNTAGTKTVRVTRNGLEDFCAVNVYDCGNGTCDGSLGETCANCPADCSCAPPTCTGPLTFNPAAWEDPVLIDGSQPNPTLIRSTHFAQMKDRIDALRIDAALPPFDWGTCGFGTMVNFPISTKLINCPREALIDVYTACSQAIPAGIQGTVSQDTPIRKQHVEDLRTAIDQAK